MKSYNKFIQISYNEISFYYYFKNKTIITFNGLISLRPSSWGFYYFFNESKYFNEKDCCTRCIASKNTQQLIKGYEE